MHDPIRAAVESLRGAGIGRGDLVAIAWAPGVGAALDSGGHAAFVEAADVRDVTCAVDGEIGPRWVVWSASESAALLQCGVALSTCWDLAAVHRLERGGWHATPGMVWAHRRGLDPATIPDSARTGAALDLFTAAERAAGDPLDPVRPDGHLRPEWGRVGWDPDHDQLRRWAALAVGLAGEQRAERVASGGRRHEMTARSESSAELLANELAVGGLPLDREVAEAIIGALVGPRPTTPAEADRERRRRDAEVLRHVPGAGDVDLRSAGQVKSLLRRVGIEVEDTRAWRLEALVDAHPVVEPLLRWRKAERIATTFGYAWLDDHVGADGRLRGEWSASDGAAGRMTASAGLHNMPSELRPAVAGEPGHLLVRSDLGQIEPRVLAAVSGDVRLAEASTADDLYAGVATTLGVERDIAKVAVLGAMYGQTTGRGAQALAELRRAYPVAMALLDDADVAARAGRDVFTAGGRRIRMDAGGDARLPEAAARSRAAARGRYGRNAIIQGAAAELFKAWALTVRARIATLDAEIVLCLHDELLVHAPADRADEAAVVVDAALQEAVRRWAPEGGVRFLADTSVVRRWSDVDH